MCTHAHTCTKYTHMYSSHTYAHTGTHVANRHTISHTHIYTPQDLQGRSTVSDLPASPTLTIQMFLHPRADVVSVTTLSQRIYFWAPTHHPLPTNFTLNKAQSLALLLGAELLGGLGKTELRTGNRGCIHAKPHLSLSCCVSLVKYPPSLGLWRFIHHSEPGTIGSSGVGRLHPELVMFPEASAGV